MAQAYIRQSTFADGDTITAALFNDEYNQLVNAFAYSSSSASSTGHRHDGTAGQGGNIFKIGDLDFLNKIEVDGSNNRLGFYVEVSSAAVEQIRIQDGAIVPVTDSDIDLGTTSLRFKDTFTDSITTTGNVDVGGNLTVTGTTTFNGGTITMGDAATDNVVFGADVDSSIIPDDDDTYDLGSSSQQWRNIFIDGTAEIDTLALDGTTVTSTAAELNILDGVTSTAAELNILDGVTATATELNILDGVTSTTAELNILDGVTANTSELNILDGVTSTTAELNILDGVTATATELNLLDGVTSTTAELNILDGVTSTTAELNLLDGVTATTTELNYVDVATAGTVEASKAIVVDSNKDFTGTRNITTTGSLSAGGGSTNGIVISQGAISIKNGGTQSYVDFYCESSNAHYTRLQAAAHSAYSGNVTVTLPATTGTLALTSGNITGNAATATALETARTIHGVSFDGTSNIDLTEVIQDTVGGMVTGNTESNITVTYQDSDGTLDFTIASLNQDTTGNAATATALETARTIGGTSFDGTANISVALADTATALATARTIGGTSFDGTANISVALADTATALATARTIHGVSFDGTANIDLTEVVQDTVGAMFSSNTETGITATYQDSDGTIDLTVTGAAVTNIADADGDTKVQVEESSDEDTIRMDVAGTEVLTLTNSAMTLKGTTPTLTIGDAGEEDTKIIFDGNAQDYYIGLRDSGDKFVVGKGQTLGTDQVFEISDGLNGNPQVGVGSGGTNPMSLSYTGTALAISESSGTASVQVNGGNAARMDFGLGGTAVFRMYNDSSSMTEFKRTTDHPIVFAVNNAETGRFMSTELKLASGKKLVGGATNVDFTIQSEHRTEIIGASKGTVILKHAGTMYGLFERPTGTNDFDIQNPIQDGDITFVGNDGGSFITALTLDMSEAGKAIFNGDIDVGGSITKTGDLTLDVSGDFVLDADGGDILLKDGGTLVGTIGGFSGNNVTIKSEASDGDLIFQGNDGGSAITALTLDMSEAGAATFNNNVTAFSDERLKDNIETLTDGLNKVEQLRGVTYTRDDREEIGVIAQEVEKILPEIVLTANDEMGTKSVDYSRITAVLIEAVKELSARVKELENK